MINNKAELVDCFGYNTASLKNKKLFLFDMDGTIYQEEKVFEGTHQLLDCIEKAGGMYVFITNNSSKSVAEYVKKLNRLGIKADRDNFFTSTQATILYLEKNYFGAKIYCQGTSSLIKELREAAINVTEAVEEVDVVLVGFDSELTSQKIRNTCEILTMQNVPFIATNPDLRCPVSFGFIPDCGSICNILTAATGKKPIYIGKPEPTMINIVREKLGYSATETVVIGDRLYTDIAAGLNAGVEAVCVLTGEATLDDIKKGDIKPTFTVKSVKEVWQSLQ